MNKNILYVELQRSKELDELKEFFKEKTYKKTIDRIISLSHDKYLK